jgi:Tol biopolymer transport system component
VTIKRHVVRRPAAVALMRRSFVIGAAIVLVGLVPSAIGANPKPKPPALGAPRILYSSDWSGQDEVYALDPSGKSQVGQLTFGRAPSCIALHPCGYSGESPSPNGRFVLFWDWVATDLDWAQALFVSRADGTGRRRLALIQNHYSEGDSSWAPDSRRVAYAGDKTGVHIVRIDGSSDRSISRGIASDLAWSPDGLSLAFIADRRLVVWHGGRAGTIASGSEFAWSPKGDWIAYDGNGLHVVRPDGTGDRRLIDSYGFDLAWSPNGRFLAFDGSGGLQVIDLESGAVRLISSSAQGSTTGIWAPRGSVLSYDSDQGLMIMDVVAGIGHKLSSDRVIGSAWSPDGRSIAYVAVRPASQWVFALGGDLKLASVSGQVRTLISAAGQYGGEIGNIRWTRPPAGIRYRAAVGRSIASSAPDQLTAPWPIERLATDGGRIAYVSCGHVFVWTPATGEVAQADLEASMSPSCPSPDDSYYTSFRIFGLALAGSRVAFGGQTGNNSRSCALAGTTLTSPPATFALGDGCHQGNLAGSDSLLVFSKWQFDPSQYPHPPTSPESIFRAGPGGCPCTELRTDPGPLAPFDVDADRIVAGGQNATVILDSAGKQLLSVPVSPVAAQLSASHLIVLVQGALRDYDADSGLPEHLWPLPDVPSCADRQVASRNDGDLQHVCPYNARLFLEDAARGFVAYVLDDQVHLLRLSDGADKTVAAGSHARFMDTGLVYADGSRLHLVPYAALPLR